MVTVVESFSTNTLLGSGLTQSREKQMENLSRNAAKLIQNWLVQQNNEFGWFEDDGRPAKEKINVLTGAPATQAEADSPEAEPAPEDAAAEVDTAQAPPAEAPPTE